MEKKAIRRNHVIYFVVFTTAGETIWEHFLKPIVQAAGMTERLWDVLWTLAMLPPFVITIFVIGAGYHWKQWRETVSIRPCLWWNLGLIVCLTAAAAAGGWKYVQDPFRMTRLVLAVLALALSTGWALAIMAASLPVTKGGKDEGGAGE